MPVLVVAADTELGSAAIEALLPAAAEVRAFVTDPDVGDGLRRRGVKVAVGDVSDASHVATAGIGAHSIVLIEEAATDDRERAFATEPSGVVDRWREAVQAARCRRLIWVGDATGGRALDGTAPQLVIVPAKGRAVGDVAGEVAAADATA